MSLAVLRSRALAGLSAPEVLVEVHIASGLPSLSLVGLPDTEVREARDRVRAALQNCGFEFPQRRITVNLAPADLPKESGRFDLPIALAILVASGQIQAQRLDDYEFAGELALSGELRPIRGALAMCVAIRRDADASGQARRGFVLPMESAAEAALVDGATVYPAPHLLAVCAHLTATKLLTAAVGSNESEAAHCLNLADVKGQTPAKRALEIAAAGAHSLLMSGPPGTGKSMLAQRLPGLLPPMTMDEALESASIHSLAGSFSMDRWRQRPFRSPHHSASMAALVGGGSPPRPGEISLAHHGLLFLDELPEFQRNVLEALREPLESGQIQVARAGWRAEYPARFMLVAAMNPCPCGFLSHPSGKCRCTPDQVARYRSKLSGPFVDRIDLMVDVPAISESELLARSTGESSADIRARVAAARVRQMARQGKPNSALSAAEIEALALPDSAGVDLLRRAVDRLAMSARGYHRVLKVARTLADLAEKSQSGSTEIAEAIQYRRGLPSEAPHS